jgi:hypothetical protein
VAVTHLRYDYLFDAMKPYGFLTCWKSREVEDFALDAARSHGRRSRTSPAIS